MAKEYEIRANYDKDTIVVYQAYRNDIAEPALKQQQFVSPFSLKRMTWIKPSFLWMMHRSQWGQKKGQENILAIRISRYGWEKALSLGVLTHPFAQVYSDPNYWEQQFKEAKVHVQWDPERSLRGKSQNHYSIQVGISRHLIEEYVKDWVVQIEDFSPQVAKMRQLLKSGNEKKAKALLPQERIYPLSPESGKRLLIR